MLDFKSCDKTQTCKKYREGTCPITNNNIDQFCIKWFKINELQTLSLLEDSQKNRFPMYLDEDGADRDVYTRLSEIEKDAENFVSQGKNLYLYSAGTGNGKTSFAIRILNAYLASIWYKAELSCKALFINVPKFLILLKDNISKKSDYIEYIKENVLNADIVIWDDIATKGFTTYEMENILNIIDNRLIANKSNIYTSNIVGDELKECIGDRLYSRVFNKSEVLEFIGKDKRSLNL